MEAIIRLESEKKWLRSMLCIHHFLFLALTNSVAILLRVPRPSSEITLELIFKASPFLSFFIIFCF